MTAGRKPIQEELRAAVRDAVAFQRDLHVKEEEDCRAAIRKAGGEIVELTADQQKAFVVSRQPDLQGSAAVEFGRELLSLVNL